MKAQISLIPETIIDLLTLIMCISFTFGMWILYSEFTISLKENSDIEKIKFYNSFIGDKCILYFNRYYQKGILDYNKIKNSCLERKYNVEIEFDNQKITLGSSCSQSLNFPIIIYKDNKFYSAKLKIC